MTGETATGVSTSTTVGLLGISGWSRGGKKRSFAFHRKNPPEGYRRLPFMDWTYGHRVVRILFHGAQYQGIANTNVQLIRRSNSGLIAPSQPILSAERHSKNGLGRTARLSGANTREQIRTSGRIPGSQKMSPRGASFSTWIQASCGKCCQLRSGLMPAAFLW
jgi:hypothetical protein